MWFTKITAWPIQKVVFNTKIYYEDKAVQSRKIKGPAIIISNHTSVMDYAAYLFVFFGRHLRFQMAEVLFQKKGLGKLLRKLDGIYVDRNSYNFSFVHESLEVLRKGGVVGIFPESRIPLPEEKKPLDFKTSAAFIALSAENDVPVIPVYTNGSYFSKKRARVIIGKPLYVSQIADSALSDKENIAKVTQAFRDKIIDLGRELNERAEK